MIHKLMHILAVFSALTCDSLDRKTESAQQGQSGLRAQYRLLVIHSDSLPQETLLKLTIWNGNDYGVMIKNPSFQIVNEETGKEIDLIQLIKLTDYDKVPTTMAYGRARWDSVDNGRPAKLERHILDSLKRKNIKLDPLKANDIHGYEFISAKDSSYFLLDLTILLNKRQGRFKIFPAAGHGIYDYSTNYVPDVFNGYLKITQNIKYDTFYLDSRWRKWSQ